MQRTGRRNRPFYRISAIDQRTRRDGRVIEALGWFDPIAKDPAKQMQLNEERIKYWVGVGAKPTETMRDFFAKRGLVDVKLWEADRAEARRVLAEKQAKAAAAPAPAEKKDEKKS
jgi:small subunit ribosomal protein S16